MVNYTVAKYDVRPVWRPLFGRIVFMQIQPQQGGPKDRIQFRDEVRIYTRISELNG